MHHTMSFYWSPNIGDFFFNGLTINTITSFTLLCIILVIFSILYEAMKVYNFSINNYFKISKNFIIQYILG